MSSPRTTRPSRSEAVTLDMLLRMDPLNRATMSPLAGMSRPVTAVHLVNDVEAARSCPPGSVLVLQPDVARSAWAVSVAVKHAWERRLACVVAQLDPAAAVPVARLAERLQVPLARHDGDLAQVALQLSAIIGQPAATQSRLVAHCAAQIMQCRHAEEVLSAVEEELPGVQVSLVTWPDPTGSHGESGETILRVPMAPLDHRRGRYLCATTDRSHPQWQDLVRQVLTIARSHVLACETAGAVRLAERRELSRWLLSQVIRAVDEDKDLDDTAAAATRDLGWRLDRPGVAAVVLCRDPTLRIDSSLDVAVAAWLADMCATCTPVRHQDGWALWSQADEPAPATEAPPEAAARSTAEPLTGLSEAVDDADRYRSLARSLSRDLHQAFSGSGGPGVDLVAGVGNPATGPTGLCQSLRQAEMAARAARANPDPAGGVPHFSSLGAGLLTAAVDTPELRAVAFDLLQPLLATEDGPTLTWTIACYLDCGASVTQTAETLGVHRNTITTRLERMRRLGIPLDDPTNKLLLHLAAHLLSGHTGSRRGPHGEAPRDHENPTTEL